MSWEARASGDVRELSDLSSYDGEWGGPWPSRKQWGQASDPTADGWIHPLSRARRHRPRHCRRRTQADQDGDCHGCRSATDGQHQHGHAHAGLRA
eukprot:6927835-Pyramimonas_sp.AAC.1